MLKNIIIRKSNHTIRADVRYARGHMTAGAFLNTVGYMTGFPVNTIKTGYVVKIGGNYAIFDFKPQGMKAVAITYQEL